MIIVSNTTPLIGLATIGQFYLLEQLFGTISIASAVYDEAVVKRHQLGSARAEVMAASWVQVVAVQDRLAVEVLLDELDLGEAETIVLAHEIAADWVLVDEKKARRKLDQLGIPKLGTAGLLLKAKQAGLIAELRPELERLWSEGFHISQPLIDALLKEAGE
jgi:predicted nucleic acid-binding protein